MHYDNDDAMATAAAITTTVSVSASAQTTRGSEQVESGQIELGLLGIAF